MTEISFSEGMEPEERLKRYKQMCTKRTPAFVISRNLEVPKELVAAAKEADIPVLRSRLKNDTFICLYYELLRKQTCASYFDAWCSSGYIWFRCVDYGEQWCW